LPPLSASTSARRIAAERGLDVAKQIHARLPGA
jgi:hypothetical protein